MSSKRDYEKAIDFIAWEMGRGKCEHELEAIRAYVTELEQCIRESSELKAETLELAERRAWEAARELLIFGHPQIDGMRHRYKDFSDWKREREGSK